MLLVGEIKDFYGLNEFLFKFLCKIFFRLMFDLGVLFLDLLLNYLVLGIEYNVSIIELGCYMILVWLVFNSNNC